MSSNIKIPTIGANPLVVIVNNKRYEFKAGEEVMVNDEVREVIENLVASFPKKWKRSVEPPIIKTSYVVDASDVASISNEGQPDFDLCYGNPDLVIEDNNIYAVPETDYLAGYIQRATYIGFAHTELFKKFYPEIEFEQSYSGMPYEGKLISTVPFDPDRLSGLDRMIGFADGKYVLVRVVTG